MGDAHERVVVTMSFSMMTIAGTRHAYEQRQFQLGINDIDKGRSHHSRGHENGQYELALMPYSPRTRRKDDYRECYFRPSKCTEGRTLSCDDSDKP